MAKIHVPIISIVITAVTSSSAMAETARSSIRFRLKCSVIRKLMHKIAFLGHSMGAFGAIQVLNMKILMQRNSVSEFHRENVDTRKTAS